MVADFYGAPVQMRPCILSQLTHLGGLGLDLRKTNGAGSEIHLSWPSGGRPQLGESLFSVHSLGLCVFLLRSAR
jgi:hypothetical protein